MIAPAIYHSSMKLIGGRLESDGGEDGHSACMAENIQRSRIGGRPSALYAHRQRGFDNFAIDV